MTIMTTTPGMNTVQQQMVGHFSDLEANHVDAYHELIGIMKGRGPETLDGVSDTLVERGLVQESATNGVQLAFDVLQHLESYDRGEYTGSQAG